MTTELTRSLDTNVDRFFELTGNLKIEERLKIWAETPIYSLRSYPLFGHRLDQFIHSSPNSQIVKVQIKFEIFEKIAEDFPYLRIAGAEVTKITDNKYAAVVQYVQNGDTEKAEIEFFFDQAQRARE